MELAFYYHMLTLCMSGKHTDYSENSANYGIMVVIDSLTLRLK